MRFALSIACCWTSLAMAAEKPILVLDAGGHGDGEQGALFAGREGTAQRRRRQDDPRLGRRHGRAAPRASTTDRKRQRREALRRRGEADPADLGQLDTELKRQAQRNWGKLPGNLRTEILQGASKKPHPEYAKQIKSYFEEIAKPAAKESGK